jgi:hypothetical protein
MFRPGLPSVFAAALLLPSLGFSSPILLGVLSFDAVDASSSTVSISNYTGDPASGGNALLPDFPVYTPVIFLSSTVTVQEGSSLQVIFLGDLLPGSHTFPGLTFANTLAIASVVLSTTLSSSSLVQADGTTLNARTTDLTVQLNPSTGSSLVPGDSGLILADASSFDVPEPHPILLICGAIAVLAGRYRRRC